MIVADDDPFGLTGFGPFDVSRRPGEKWQLAGGRLASWVADMDFPIAPAIVERLTRRVAEDVGYPTWDDAGRSPLVDRFVERMADRYGWSPDAGATARAGRRDAGGRSRRASSHLAR